MSPNTNLIFPMFAMVMLTLVILVLMGRARIRAVATGEVKPDYYKTFEGQGPSRRTRALENHFRNLFELPVLFYAGCLVAMIMPLEGVLILVWAWLFVAARVIHAWIHLTSNRLPLRMAAYTFGCIAVLALWIQIIWALTLFKLSAIALSSI